MGVITFGTSFVGKVDRVEGVGYVVTKAFQVVNVPLIPLGGYFVHEGTEKQTFVSGLCAFEGTEMPSVSWKSFAWGLARVLMFAFGLLSVLGLPIIWLDVKGPLGFVVGPGLGIALLAAWWMTRRGLHASATRAIELNRMLAKAATGHAQRWDKDIS